MHKRLQTRLCDYGDASESLSSAREKAGVHETSALRVFNRLQRIDLYKKSVKKHLSPSRRRALHYFFLQFEDRGKFVERQRQPGRSKSASGFNQCKVL